LLKIHQLFLRTYLTIFLLILLSLSIISYFWSKEIYLNQIEKNLIQNINVVSILLKNKDEIKNIEQIVHDLHEKLNLRITIIDELGIVIAESDKNLSQISNHLNRKEIIEAKYNDIGKDRRKSETMIKTYYMLLKK